jgi:hypothetical protein
MKLPLLQVVKCPLQLRINWNLQIRSIPDSDALFDLYRSSTLSGDVLFFWIRSDDDLSRVQSEVVVCQKTQPASGCHPSSQGMQTQILIYTITAAPLSSAFWLTWSAPYISKVV